MAVPVRAAARRRRRGWVERVARGVDVRVAAMQVAPVVQVVVDRVVLPVGLVGQLRVGARSSGAAVQVESSGSGGNRRRLVPAGPVESGGSRSRRIWRRRSLRRRRFRRQIRLESLRQWWVRSLWLGSAELWRRSAVCGTFNVRRVRRECPSV